MISPTFNKSSNSFFVQVISYILLHPFNLSLVSISAENLFIFFIIAIFQFIDFSSHIYQDF